MSPELELERGWVATELADEFPELALATTEVEAGVQRSPASVRERLKLLSNRVTGGRAVNMRQQPIPAAYRIFFRQIGIDPDTHRTPPEEIILERMKLGGFPSQNLVADALTIAIVETGVSVIALDAESVDGPLGLRLSAPGERLGGEGGRPLSVRQILVADASRSVAVLFGDLAEGCEVTRSTSRTVVCATRVKGVPEVSVEEALWTAVEVLREASENPAAGGS